MTRHRSRGRDVDGIVLLDKPVGLSSNDALQRVKRLFGARKAGHTGSLDRLASGLLPICLGEATKISGVLLNADKHYLATFRLGERTTTGDAEGEVLEQHPVEGITRAAVEAALARFLGPIEQVPPMHSAIKFQGKPLYKLAHQGIEIERQPRQVVIHALDLLAFDGRDVAVSVRCSKGTYVRTLAEDVGAALGCGAHVAALRRLGSGPYQSPEMVTLEQLASLACEGQGALDGVILPIESAVGDWPDIRLPEDMAYYLRQGQAVLVPRAPTRGWVRLYGGDARFLGVGEVLDDGRIAPRRLFHPPSG
ncbi:MAG: tRNA pseudouridine(55) synthase TruB [Gammaproteobacteria bacterium]|jgi:tRNA pseudouridine55 synthase|nr:tRNA pseudouridine(55) synthase TruB [Gammaproteobacteria bacterium]